MGWGLTLIPLLPEPDGLRVQAPNWAWGSEALDTVVFTLWAGLPVKDHVLGGMLIFQYMMLAERAVESGRSGIGTFRVPCL